LRAHVAHALRFAKMLEELCEAVPFDDATSPWLIGRADEVRVFVSDVLHEWSERDLDPVRAAGMVEGYLAELHAALGALHDLPHELPCCIRNSFPEPGSGTRRTVVPPRGSIPKLRPSSRPSIPGNVPPARAAR
jgi:hypothetical protein